MYLVHDGIQSLIFLSEVSFALKVKFEKRDFDGLQPIVDFPGEGVLPQALDVGVCSVSDLSVELVWTAVAHNVLLNSANQKSNSNTNVQVCFSRYVYRWRNRITKVLR